MSWYSKIKNIYIKNNRYTNIYDYFIENDISTRSQVKNIYARLHVGSTVKTTKQNRMEKITEYTIDLLKRNFDTSINICDFGISSGQTTYDLYKKCNNIGLLKTLYGFDRQIYASMLCLGKFIFLFSKENDLMFGEYDKHALRTIYFYPLKKVDQLLLFFLKKFLKKSFEIDVIINELKEKNDLYYSEENIFNINKKYHNKFEFIRVSNLLNKVYFSDRDIIIALINIKNILREDGILLINRTNSNDVDNGTFFIKKNNKLEVIEDFNNGSEVKELIKKLDND